MVSDDRVGDHVTGSSIGHLNETFAREADRVVVSTTDPAITSGQVGARAPGVHPNQTIIAETGQVADKADGREPKDIGELKNGGHEHPKPEARPARPSWKGYALIGVVALAFGSGLTWASMHFFSSGESSQAKGSEESRQSKKDASDSPPKTGDDKSSGIAPTSADGGDNSGNQIRNLSARFDTLRQRIDTMSMPRDTNSPDLMALRLRMEELSRSINETRELPSRFREMQARQDRLEAEMKSHDDRPVDKAQQLPPTPNTAVVASPKLEVKSPVISASAAKPDPAGDALAEGMSLFKKGEYSQAEVLFRGLRQTKPQDARVWYFSALANGLSTGHWEGESRTFVVQGAERERAGLPGTTLIDFAFADLSPASGKDWLASYRNQLLKR